MIFGRNIVIISNSKKNDKKIILIKTEEWHFNLPILFQIFCANDIYIILNIKYLILIKYFFIYAKWFSTILLLTIISHWCNGKTMDYIIVLHV